MVLSLSVFQSKLPKGQIVQVLSKYVTGLEQINTVFLPKNSEGFLMIFSYSDLFLVKEIHSISQGSRILITMWRTIEEP